MKITKYKSFRKQVKECKQIGNIKVIDCKYAPICSYSGKQKILLCIKYLDICSSELCKKDRIE